MLLGARDRLHAALTRYGKPARTFSLIHADLHPRNVLIDGAHAAVIDFDDAGFGWHQYDLAVAVIGYQDHPDFVSFRDACIAGYRSVRVISDADLALLPMFLLIRDMAQIGWYISVRNCHGQPCCRGSSSASAPGRRTSSRQSETQRRCRCLTGHLLTDRRRRYSDTVG